MIINSLLSSNSDDLATPKELYKIFIDLGFYDPCPLYCHVDNIGKKVKQKYVFCNPPFSKKKEWFEYMMDLWHDGHNIVLLIPLRVFKGFDTFYFFGFDICIFRSRFHFNESKAGAPFDTCLIHMFHFSNHGKYLFFNDFREYQHYLLSSVNKEENFLHGR